MGEFLELSEVLRRQDVDDSAESDFPCPEIVWQGIFQEVADRLGRRSWEIWAGTLAGLAATAHKNLHWYYHRDLYGMVYLLLVAPTGVGKGLVTDIAYDLLPAGYTTRDSVQSGPALAPILATITRSKGGEFESALPRPVLLLIEEWSQMVKASKIEFSNLQDILNTLFHRSRPWNLSRSDRSGSGGDVVIPNPTLTICATTTESLLRANIGEKEIRSGFLNRYLIIPGTLREWKFYTPGAANTSTHTLNGLLEPLRAYAWGAGRSVWEAYSPDALARVKGWGEANLEHLMNDQGLEAEATKRLHVYLHILALLYAWQGGYKLVEPQHVEAAIQVIAVSQEFVRSLMRRAGVEVPKFKQWEIEVERKVFAKIEEKPGITHRELYLLLHRHGSAKDISTIVQKLQENKAVVGIKKGKTLGFVKS